MSYCSIPTLPPEAEFFWKDQKLGIATDPNHPDNWVADDKSAYQWSEVKVEDVINLCMLSGT